MNRQNRRSCPQRRKVYVTKVGEFQVLPTCLEVAGQENSLCPVFTLCSVLRSVLRILTVPQCSPFSRLQTAKSQKRGTFFDPLSLFLSFLPPFPLLPAPPSPARCAMSGGRGEYSQLAAVLADTVASRRAARSLRLPVGSRHCFWSPVPRERSRPVLAYR